VGFLTANIKDTGGHRWIFITSANGVIPLAHVEPTLSAGKGFFLEWVGANEGIDRFKIHE
jgi:hypothetical protein